VIQRFRSRVAGILRPVLYAGSKRTCPYCERSFRRFKRGGVDVPILREADVVGAGRRDEVHCPVCLCTDRERLVYLWLRRVGGAFDGAKDVLHVAPEPRLAAELRRIHRYVSVDLADPSAQVHCDVTALAFPSERFALVVCNHVLEHVTDDRAAMREIRRVLQPGGIAILQVPIARRLPATIEDPSAKSEEERRRRFGQLDHVRLYSADDYLARLREAGLSVERFSFATRFGAGEAARYGIDPREEVFVARR
jgi:hypothetical protein